MKINSEVTSQTTEKVENKILAQVIDELESDIWKQKPGQVEAHVWRNVTQKIFNPVRNPTWHHPANKIIWKMWDEYEGKYD